MFSRKLSLIDKDFQSFRKNVMYVAERDNWRNKLHIEQELNMESQ